MINLAGAQYFLRMSGEPVLMVALAGPAIGQLKASSRPAKGQLNVRYFSFSG